MCIHTYRPIKQLTNKEKNILFFDFVEKIKNNTSFDDTAAQFRLDSFLHFKIL